MNKREELSTVYNSYKLDDHPTMRRLRDQSGRRFVPGVGNVDAKVLFLGEAPGETEARTGEPFVGPAGRVLDTWLFVAGLKRDQVFITNAVKYRPVKVTTGANRRPFKAELEVSRPYLQMEVSIIRPQWIVPLGVTAVNMLWLHELGDVPTMRDAHGQTFFRRPRFRRVYVMYHPAAVLHDESKVDAALADAVELGRLVHNDGHSS